jgi:predicted pyridoxine 5'-phosphate oxidase superfamily flavin-nucleotide-binding protein
MDEMYHEGNRELQERFDTRRLADRIENLLVHDTFTDRDKGFVESRDMFFLATADEQGRPNVSYKGGDPGSSASWTSTRLPSPTTTATGCTSRWAIS